MKTPANFPLATMTYTSPDFYELLSLPKPPTSLTPQLIRKAYHAALLKHHPDKRASPSSCAPSIDLLTLAYKTLSTPELRREYDLTLDTGSEVGSEVVQTVDLDEFTYTEEGRYTKACRCGEEEGFVISEEELEGAAKEGLGEVLVGCIGCSLWWRVAFEAVEE
jgi:diphthamide biosynthesis protein 4